MSSATPPGFVESISADGRTIKGWAYLRDMGGVPDIGCFVRATYHHVGVVSWGNSRPDVLEAKGIPGYEFSIRLEATLPPGALLTGEYVVRNKQSGEELRPTVGLGKKLQKELLHSLGIKSAEANRMASPEATKPLSCEDLVPVWFPVGLTSADGSAAVGRDGYVFLVGGSNDVQSRYRVVETAEERRKLEAYAQQWVEIFEARSRTLEDLGIPYCQTILPEKSTGLSHLIDFPAPITPELEAIEEKLAGKEWYFSCRQALASIADPKTGWLRYDSHMSPLGAQTTIRELARHLLLPDSQILSSDLSTFCLLEGDLSQRLFGVELWDPQFGPEATDTVDGGPPPQLVLATSPEPGKHVGTRRTWKRESAPYDVKVAVFGSSSFGRGSTSRHLNWWMSRTFREVHFLWSSEFDLDFVREVNPDVVVCQTAERFLGRFPRA